LSYTLLNVLYYSFTAGLYSNYNEAVDRRRPQSLIPIKTSIREARPSPSSGFKPILGCLELEPSRGVRLGGPRKGPQDPPLVRDGRRSLHPTLTSSEPAAHARGRILAELVWSRQSIHLLNASAFNVSLPPSGSNLYRRLIVHSIFRNHIFLGN
jgi:hypothetical protein